MSQRLFSVPKIGLFLDSITHATEKRREEEVKIVTLTLRAQPFGADLARAVDDGVGGDSGLRSTLFKLNHPDPKPHLKRVDFSVGCPRQQLHVFAAPDTTTPSLMLDQVKIFGTYARTEKDLNGYGFVFKASFGPPGRKELEFITDWHLSQRFVTFQEAEPGLDFGETDEDDDETTDADEKAERPAPMWNDDEPAAAASEKSAKSPRKARDDKNVNRKLHSHTRGKKKGRR